MAFGQQRRRLHGLLALRRAEQRRPAARAVEDAGSKAQARRRGARRTRDLQAADEVVAGGVRQRSGAVALSLPSLFLWSRLARRREQRRRVLRLLASAKAASSAGSLTAGARMALSSEGGGEASGCRKQRSEGSGADGVEQRRRCPPPPPFPLSLFWFFLRFLPFAFSFFFSSS